VKRWALPVVAALTGALWAVRNLIAQGQLFSAGALEIQQYSILNNLSNPYLYNYLDLYLKEMLALFGITLLLSLVWKTLRFHWSSACRYPASRRPAPSSAAPAALADRPASGAVSALTWRPSCLPSGTWPVGSSRAAPLRAAHGHARLQRLGTYPNPTACTLTRVTPSSCRPVPQSGRRGRLLQRHDYVRKNVRGSVVGVENGLPFYVFGPGLSNTITRTRKPDYYLIFQNPGSGVDGYPEMTAAADWAANWRVVYTDSRSRVYERK
jgi:hypothetical protein